MVSARELALKALYKIDTQEGFSNIVLDDILSGQEIKEIDKAFITEIVYGVTSRKLTLDYIVSNFSKIKINKISPWIKNILRIGIYQMIYLDRVPDSAACNESVKLARRYGHKASSGFVNAMLRKVASTENVLEQVNELNDIDRLSIKYSHPKWLIQKWIEQLGIKLTDELCEANNQKPQISLRVNTLKCNTQDLLILMDKSNIKAEKSKFLENGLIFKHGNPINDFYKNGYYTVQDEAAMIVSEVLSPKPGEMVADVCSAPGGKTTHMAQIMENHGRIIAMDIYEHRLELINKTAKRLGIGIIETRLHDATVLDKEFVNKCDKILVDVPCSGLGVIRRKPEIKWKRTHQDLKELAKVQLKILETSSKYLKKEGRMVYSTCTINREENEEIIEEFLKRNSDFELEIINVSKFGLGRESKYIQLYPNIHGTDGFFIASIRKIK